MAAQVLPFRRPTTDWRAEEAQVELAARRSEEQEQALIADPMLRRLELLAHEFGPAAWQLYAGLAHWHRRHAARWADDDDGTVA